MEFVANPPTKLLEFAENVQKTILDGGVHFIDIFQLNNNEYTISEVNTACSLLIHERKAREAGHKFHDISYQLAKYYVSLLD